jgi:hypothetical protein
MARLVINVTCDNASFQDGRGEFAPEPEIVYVLIHFIAAITRWGKLPIGSPVVLRDSKGALVGSAKLITSRALDPAPLDAPWSDPQEDETAPRRMSAPPF